MLRSVNLGVTLATISVRSGGLSAAMEGWRNPTGVEGRQPPSITLIDATKNSQPQPVHASILYHERFHGRPILVHG